MRNKTLILFLLFFTGFKCANLDSATRPGSASDGMGLAMPTDTITSGQNGGSPSPSDDVKKRMDAILESPLPSGSPDSLLPGGSPDSFAVLEEASLQLPEAQKGSETSTEGLETTIVQTSDVGVSRYIRLKDIPADDDRSLATKIKGNYERLFKVSNLKTLLLFTKVSNEGNIGEVYKSLTTLSSPSSTSWISFQSVFDSEQILSIGLDWDPVNPRPLTKDIRDGEYEQEAKGISFNRNELPSVEELAIAASYLVSKCPAEMAPFTVVAKYFEDKTADEAEVLYHYPIYLLRENETYLLTPLGAEKLMTASPIDLEGIKSNLSRNTREALTSEESILLLNVNECGQVFNLWGERMQNAELLGNFPNDPIEFRLALSDALRVRGVQLLVQLFSLCASDLQLCDEEGKLIKQHDGGVLQRLPVGSYLDAFATGSERVFKEQSKGTISKSIGPTQKVTLPNLIEDLSIALKNIWNSAKESKKEPIFFCDLVKKSEEAQATFDPNKEPNYFINIAQNAVANFDTLLPELFSEDGKRFLKRS